jgi:hypothetical protein
MAELRRAIRQARGGAEVKRGAKRGSITQVAQGLEGAEPEKGGHRRLFLSIQSANYGPVKTTRKKKKSIRFKRENNFFFRTSQLAKMEPGRTPMSPSVHGKTEQQKRALRVRACIVTIQKAGQELKLYAPPRPARSDFFPARARALER